MTRFDTAHLVESNGDRGATTVSHSGNLLEVMPDDSIDVVGVHGETEAVRRKDAPSK